MSDAPVPERRRRARCSGFVLPSAIFLLVILSGLAAFLVQVSTSQSIVSAQDVQGSRAYQAARAGMEWGLYQVLDPTNATVVPPSNAAWPNMPACPADTTLTIDGFTVVFRCLATPADYFEAGNTRRIRVYQLASTASFGAVGTNSYVEREVTVTVSKCRALYGTAPDYACS